MKTVGVIAEYNPFHNGHAYQLRSSKAQTGADFAVAVMSGEFVQRGEPAMFSKHDRARWALNNGADMVLALPTPFSLSSAELFALGAVSILESSGIVDCISFGSECGNMTALKIAADILYDEPEQFKSAMRQGLNAGLSYPDARSRALAVCIGDSTYLPLSSPNDTLGIEYLRALRALGSGMSAAAVKRTSAAHDSSLVCGEFASASYIRSCILSKDTSVIRNLVPEDVLEDILKSTDSGAAPITADALSSNVIYAFRRMTKLQLAALPDVAEGLENLLYSACRQAGDLSGVLEQIKSRRYTMARLKRICMCALLGIYTPARSLLPALYIRVIGLRREAMPLLSALHEQCSLPIITSFKDAEKLNPQQRTLFETDMLASDISALGTPSPSPAKFDYSYPLLIV